jgi:N6-adenosine-specific RNA methylase IME4
VPRYQTVVADCPWKYNQTRQPMKRGGRGASAEAHYPTMTNAELAALRVADFVEDQAHLYMWVTNPRLYGEQKSRDVSPVDIAEAWGFRYVTLLTWIKQGAPGPGWYFRGYTEHVLFCVRGKLGIPAADRLPNYFIAPKGRHSVKPGLFYDLVERVSPAPRLEMFARTRRLGWDSWGNEVDSDLAIGEAL